MFTPRQTDSQEGVTDVERLIGMVNGVAMAQAMGVAAELGLPDLLANGRKHVEEFAQEAGCQSRSLHRLMRALASLDLCTEYEDGSFSLTPLGALLRNDTPDSLRCWTIWAVRYLWPLWGNLLHSVRTGESARTLLYGTVGFEHLEHGAVSAPAFNRAMADVTRLVARGVVRSCDFSGMQRIVDVGGGCGDLLATILQAYPGARGVLLDRSHAMDDARGHLEAARVIDRCEMIAGDFFASVPAGGDAYLLKSVIHDWGDEQCAVILRNCRTAMGGRGKLLIVEQIMPEKMESSSRHQDAVRKDLSMLIGPGGRERTKSEFSKLLECTGFRLEKLVPAALHFSVIEAVPR